MVNDNEEDKGDRPLFWGEANAEEMKEFARGCRATITRDAQKEGKV
nr:hypothetical protein Itr_chr08CG21620 [Ipomoea trifida]